MLKKAVLLLTALVGLTTASQSKTFNPYDLSTGQVTYHVTDAGWQNAGQEVYEIVVVNDTSDEILYSISCQSATGPASWSDWELGPGKEDSKAVNGEPYAISVTWKAAN